MALSSASQPDARSSAASPSPSAKTQGSLRASTREGYRETVEAIVVAGILALLVRGFEVEAFVIPTGSMAPTLMGRHKEVTCPECEYVYTVNASEEVEGYSGHSPSSRRVFSGVCENCRFQARIVDEPSFRGDRILVMKFPYDMPSLPGSGGPDRWDVVVFRYPEEPETSYIKRLVGLPGETIRVWHGDIFVKPQGGTDFQRTRRPLEHQTAMQMMVYDDAHRPISLRERPEWQRWTATEAGTWTEDPKIAPGTHVAHPSADHWVELRYRNLVPEPVQWQSIVAGEPLSRGPRPTLITDFYSYNTNLSAENSDLSGQVVPNQESAWLQPHWVGDLTVSARLKNESATGSVRFDLIEGGVLNRCQVDLSSGEAVFFHAGVELGRGPSGLSGAGRHDVVFANVDNRLILLVEGRPAVRDGFTYDDPPGVHPEPTVEDLAPVRIAVNGAALQVSDLVLKRDIYYTLTPGRIDYGNAWDPRLPRNPTELAELLADPAKVAGLGQLAWKDYPMGSDRFLMLGDNSPRSKDGRGWDTTDRHVPADPENGLPDRGWDTTGREAWEVPRNMLTGKAFCTYIIPESLGWPRGKPLGLNLKRVKWIH